jgi:hypothetical protein
MKMDFRKDTRRGAAWLSSARVVRCWVKSRNERNPCPLLPSGYAGHSEETAGDKPEEGGDDVKSARPLCLGLHTCYNGRYKASRAREGELIAENRSQFGLKSESLVIADQHAAVNTFPGLVHTARHITKAGCTRSRCANPQGRQAPKVWSVIGVKS